MKKWLVLTVILLVGCASISQRVASVNLGDPEEVATQKMLFPPESTEAVSGAKLLTYKGDLSLLVANGAVIAKGTRSELRESAPSLISELQRRTIADYEEQQRQDKRIDDLLSKTPHEICKQGWQRYGTIEDCRIDVRREQDALRAQIAANKAAHEARKNAIIPVLMNRITPTPVQIR